MGGKPRKKPVPARAAPARKKPTTSSAAKARAARANGAKGGRPQKHRYDEVFAALERPRDIEDPLQLVPWAMRALAITIDETMRGHGSTALNAELRATVRAIKALVPMERLRQAEAIVKGAATHANKKHNKPKGRQVTAAPPASTPIR